MTTLLFAALLGGSITFTVALWIGGGLLLATGLAPLGASLSAAAVAVMLGSRRDP